MENNNSTEENNPKATQEQDGGFQEQPQQNQRQSFAKKEAAKHGAQQSPEQPQQQSDQEAPQADAAEQIAQLQEINRRLTLSLAHVQNESKLTAKRAEEKAAYAVAAMAKDLTSVVQTFALAVEAMEKAKQEINNQLFNSCIEGVEMTMKTLTSTLAKHGIEIINPLNEIFNSGLHEAVSMVPSQAPRNAIINVLQVGSSLNGRLITLVKKQVKEARTQSRSGTSPWGAFASSKQRPRTGGQEQRHDPEKEYGMVEKHDQGKQALPGVLIGLPPAIRKPSI